MLSLAIECSGQHGSIAILRDDELIDLVQLPTDRSSVQTLAEAIASALGPLGAKPDFISVTVGPGSFTGLRGGITTAKMLGLAWNIPLIAVDTLEVVAHSMNCRLEDARPVILVPVLNAFRRQVFTAAWMAESPGTIFRLAASQVVDAQAWMRAPLESLAGLDLDAANRAGPTSSVAVSGPGLQQYQPIGETRGSGKLIVLDRIEPSAQWVARIGAAAMKSGHFTTAAELAPNYIRPSAAEEKNSATRR